MTDLKHFFFFKISYELANLDSEIYALDIGHAFVGILFLEVRRKFMPALPEIEYIRFFRALKDMLNAISYFKISG